MNCTTEWWWLDVYTFKRFYVYSCDPHFTRYQNGEKGEWCKSNNFELATRIPMVVSVPQAWGGWRRGVVEPTVVESLDLFPSLADLAGIPPVKQARARAPRPHPSTRMLARATPSRRGA